MAVKKYSQLEKLIMGKIENALNNEVLKVVKWTERQAIEKVVYDVYKPNPKNGYVRRMRDGGLLSESNIKGVVGKLGKNKSRLSVSNVTRMSGDPNQYLTPLIVYGHIKAVRVRVGDTKSFWGGGYSYYPYFYTKANSDAYYARPRNYLDRTRLEIKDNNYHVNALKQGLKRQGVKVK